MGSRRFGGPGSRPLDRLCRGQSGYTFAEILVILGTIAVLGAVVIPAVGRFSSSDGEDPKALEKGAVQEAFRTLMEDQGLVYIDGVTYPDISVNRWSTLPTGPGTVSLTAYLDNPKTVFYYCYDSAGMITQQDERATPCP